jgi:hypothetical protein
MDVVRTRMQGRSREEDLRGLDLAHAALDELGVPREDEGGRRFTLFGRIEQLRAGKLDRTRLSGPSADPDLRRCGCCGFHALPRPDGACPSCGTLLG